MPDCMKVQDLLSGPHYLWHGVCDYVELNLNIVPVHIFRSRKLDTP